MDRQVEDLLDRQLELCLLIACDQKKVKRVARSLCLVDRKSTSCLLVASFFVFLATSEIFWRLSAFSCQRFFENGEAWVLIQQASVLWANGTRNVKCVMFWEQSGVTAWQVMGSSQIEATQR